MIDGLKLARSARAGMIYNVTCISLRRDRMQVAKWGNSLAIRLPSAVVEALELKEGDQIEIRIAGAREFEVRRDRTREKALERLRRLRRPLPAGFTFEREEANER
jgi:antitoxin MazE